LTTYTQSGVKDVVTTSYSGNIEPVTDPVTVQPDQVTVTEDITSSITFTLNTVDNSFGTPYATVVQNSAGDPITSISFTYTNSSNVGNGQFGVTLGGIHFNPGETKDVPVTISGNSITLDFLADGNESGTANFTYVVFSQEVNAANVEQTTNILDITIDPVADGLTILSPAVSGDEDTLIQITDPLSASNLIDNTSNTTPETLKTVMLGDVPNGWLVFYGPSQTQAQNIGGGKWNIPISGTNVPEIYVQAPPQVGNVTQTFQLITGVEDGGQQANASTPIEVTVNAVADPITLNPSPTGGTEGTPIPLNFNTTSVDVDGSEYYEVRLKGLGEGAIFYLGTTELDATIVTYDRGTDTYSIVDTTIQWDTIDDLNVVQNDMNGTIDVTIDVYDDADILLDTTAESFTINIEQQHGTTSNDTLLYDTNGVDGLDGDDTIIFGTDWDGQNTIDMSVLKNVETFDLTVHGDHTMTITTTDVENMTDAGQALVVNTDAGDTITLLNDLDNPWAETSTTGLYEDINGATIQINGGGTVVYNTANDDVLGYNGQMTVDGLGGIDRLVIFDGAVIDYTKMQNIETLDLSIAGDHDIGTLSLANVLSITDANNDLTIEGDNANDTVTFDTADGWVQGSSDGIYTSYTNSSDPTVLVKVDDDIAVTVV